jgi:hypothetical protein
MRESFLELQMFDKLLAKVARDFPDHRPLKHFEAALKVYKLVVVASVLERHELPIIGRYMLRAIQKGRETPQQIAQALGLEERDLAPSGAIMLSAGLIAYGGVAPTGQRELIVTAEGDRFLSGATEVARPRKRILYLQFNPLTRAVVLDKRGTLSESQAKKQGLPIIVGDAGKPSLGDLRLSSVQEALAREGDRRDEDILNLISLEQARPAYLPDIQVFVIRHRQTGGDRFVAYRGFQYLADESGVLEGMRVEGKSIVPDDAVLLDPGSWDTDMVLSPEAARAVRDRVETERRLFHTQLDLVARESIPAESQMLRDERDSEIAELRRQREELQEQRDALQKQLDRSEVEFIGTEQHRLMLEKALNDAQNEVIIISPWMNRRAVDSALVELMAAAISRGVRIRIGYGYRSGNPSEEQRARANAEDVKWEIRRRIGESPLMDIRDIGGTHQKILVCDRNFGIVGSLNWLSYRGDRDAGYRPETSSVLRNHVDVDRLAQLALGAIGGNI